MVTRRFSMQLSVYQLQNQIIFPLYQTSFYNNTDFAVDPVPLGTSTSNLSQHIPIRFLSDCPMLREMNYLIYISRMIIHYNLPPISWHILKVCN